MFQKYRLIGLTLFIFFANLFFFRMIGSLAVSLFLSGFFIYLLSSLPVRKYYGDHKFALLFNLAFAAVLMILIPLRGSIWIQLGLVGGLYLLALNLVYTVKSGISWFRSAGEVIQAPIILALSHLISGFSLIGRLTSPANGHHHTAVFKKTVIYLISFFAGLFIITVLLSLFSVADPIFARALSRITAYLSFDRITQRIILSLVLAVFCAPVAGMIISQRLSLKISESKSSALSEAMTVIMGMVFAAIGFFLAVQWQYVFANVARETDLSKFGVATYSEYVRRGFAEFLIAGVIIYTLVWLGYTAVRSSFFRKSALSFIQIGVVIECLIYLLSIGRRIYLYWQFHGLTLVRTYGAVFLLYITGLTVILLLRHFSRRKWVRYEIIWTAALILFLGVFNAEDFLIAHHPPTVNNKVDYVYLSRLSPDGYRGWIQSYNFAADTVSRLIDIDPASLTEDNRRDLSKSQLIIGSVTKSYLSLTKIYGGDQDKSRIAGLISAQYRGNLTDYLSIAKGDLDLISARGNKETGRLDHIFGSFSVTDNRGSFLKSQIDLARKKSDSVQKSGMSDINQIYTDTDRIRLMGYLTGTCILPYYNQNPSVWCMPGYFEFYTHQVSKPLTADYLLMWNFRYAQAYRQLQSDIPFENLIALQDSFTKIYYRLMTLPDKNRNFSQDNSTEALFLESD
jgi:hypothetical protein